MHVCSLWVLCNERFPWSTEIWRILEFYCADPSSSSTTRNLLSCSHWSLARWDASGHSQTCFGHSFACRWYIFILQFLSQLSGSENVAETFHCDAFSRSVFSDKYRKDLVDMGLLKELITIADKDESHINPIPSLRNNTPITASTRTDLKVSATVPIKSSAKTPTPPSGPRVFTVAHTESGYPPLTFKTAKDLGTGLFKCELHQHTLREDVYCDYDWSCDGASRQGGCLGGHAIGAVVHPNKPVYVCAKDVPFPLLLSCSFPFTLFRFALCF